VGTATTATCTLACKDAECGDDFIQIGVEQCDDGPLNGNDKACKADCKDKQVCGDGFVGPGEACDDGNMVNEDTARTCASRRAAATASSSRARSATAGAATATRGRALLACKTAKCGDSFTQPSVEECDDGNLINTDACLGTCKNAKCGDGVLRMGLEECDDGNQNNADMCTNMCMPSISLIGSYNVHSGPDWPTNPPVYSCREACALLFGGVANQYQCSTNGMNITGTAFLSGWGDPQYCTNPQSQDFKKNTFYNCGFGQCSYSAYVRDHCFNNTSINYCWK
jgi:cysteine-rich repeat protein